MNQVEQLCMGCMAEKSSEGMCPICGYDDRTAYDQNYLAPGTVLGSRYLVGALKHRNGERGEYIGFDNNLQTPVWIREYFPYTIAHRDQDRTTVMPNSGYGAQYKALMSDYVDVCNEVKRLSVSDPVIPLENVIGENNTVYGIYKHMDVLSLEEYLTTQGGRLPYTEAVEMLTPLFHAVDNMHLRGVIHRGLSPYTVFVSPAGKMYMDAFALSGTRTAGSELQAELFNGYSAPEQYAAKGWQGTWTDVYALAAIFYRVNSGVVPPKATLISPGRLLTPLGELVSTVPAYVSTAIADAMQSNTNQRTQTVGALTSVIHSNNDSPRTAVFDFVPMISDTPTASRRNIPDDYGHTEEVNLEDIESQFYFNEDTPPRTSRPSRGPNTPNYRQSDYNQDPYDEYDDYGPEPARSSGVNRAIIVAILAVMVLVGVVVAVVLSNKIVNPNGPSSTQSSEPMTSEPSQNESSPSSSVSESSEEELEKAKIPGFVGETAAIVTKDTGYKEKYNFKIVEKEDDKIPVGEIISQDPREDKEVEIKKGEKIDVELTVSKGAAKLLMPNVTGMTYDDAIAALERFAKQEEVVFKVAAPLEIYAPNYPVGFVARTTPTAGEEFDPKTVEVELHLAIGTTTQQSEEKPSSSESSEESKSSTSSKPSSSSSEWQPESRESGDPDVNPNPPPKKK